MRSLKYAIYKGKNAKFGGVQFQQSPVHYYCLECKAKNYYNENHPPVNDPAGCTGKMTEREGAVFVEITSAIKPDVYDWANKIVMALSVTDLGKLLGALRSGAELKLFHDPGAGSDKKGATTKQLLVSYGPDGVAAGCMLTARMSQGTTKVEHKVPLTYDEVCVLGTLVASAIPKCLNW